MADVSRPHTVQDPAPPAAGWRARMGAFIGNQQVEGVILSLIVINAIIMGLQTSPGVMASFGGVINLLDNAILAIFVVELLVRIYVNRLAFFSDPWSLFDFAVVGIALMPATGQFAVLRALRVLRVLRVLTIVPSMRRVVGALLGAMPGLFSIAAVLFLIYYVAAVMATNLFAESFPEWFGNIGASLYTLFQVMTLESWSMGIVRPVMEKFPYAWMFFIPFIMIATFSMLNLFIAVIVNAMQDVTNAEQELRLQAAAEGDASKELDLHQEVRALRSEIGALHQLLAGRLGPEAELTAAVPQAEAAAGRPAGT